MHTIKGTVKNGVIYPLESGELPEGKSVTIIIPDENLEDKSVQPKQLLSELLLLPELEENELLFERDKDPGRDIIL